MTNFSLIFRILAAKAVSGGDESIRLITFVTRCLLAVDLTAALLTA